MPAKRVPWFKFWIGATTHGKVRQLEDGEFRTWVELLDAASQQPKRGRFTSRKEAIAITRRPGVHLNVLIDAGLLDEAEDGALSLHDWDDWQRWRASDDEPGSPTDTPPERHTNNSRTTTDDDREYSGIESGIQNGTAQEALANLDSSRVRAPGRSSEEERREIRIAKAIRQSPDEKITPINRPNKSALVIDAIRGLGVEPHLGPRDHAAIKACSPFDPDLIAEVYVAISQHRYGSAFQLQNLAVHTVIGWLPGYLAQRAKPVTVNGRGQVEQPRRIVDKTGVAV